MVVVMVKAFHAWCITVLGDILHSMFLLLVLRSLLVIPFSVPLLNAPVPLFLAQSADFLSPRLPLLFLSQA